MRTSKYNTYYEALAAVTPAEKRFVRLIINNYNPAAKGALINFDELYKFERDFVHHLRNSYWIYGPRVTQYTETWTAKTVLIPFQDCLIRLIQEN